MTNSTIGILLISTWKYNKFIDSTISGIRKYFFPNNLIKIFLHTDSEKQHDADYTIKINHKPWPLITLNRFDTFINNKNIYDTDYLFYLDIDTKIIDYIEHDILSEFTVVQHHWFVGQRGTPETNTKSLAFISPREQIIYVAGGFFGGYTNKFLEIAEILNNNIATDLKNNIIAIWHDESHLNRYVASNANKIKIISPKYMYSPSNTRYKLNDPKIIAFMDSEKGFDKFENSIHK